mmetsp:Transcript_21645/g.43759  ORF Transcript_21645/g.43759 Transcript_21645/m.43759 type:complete len:115 (-) Transcript_21645:97-441(-)|eukprot:CAMPEP_0183306426 /NCGR_PEP_ID=MMETSP0160_2-20130417/11227_1 /TAXON_ID=2839 ORGANISM="Odontella Sinensis, Strain Grunow 1884" /NCGR_SAMPLE_ID=MMETSP0160_2 /ASSEMBLY_ACC=CAM_ASM_000250 /LENGTH=114 /DNA_ID=CAMNT_0025469791 /DNA_START=70 /DNA_END=414 /DNA_ORIENTATION=+
MALRMLTEKVSGVAATFYQRTLANQLAKTGMRYEDLLIQEQGEVKEAIELADPDVIAGRNRRIKRAIDLSFKRKSLLDYAPDMKQEPFKFEIYEDMEKIRARDQELAALNVENK